MRAILIYIILFFFPVNLSGQNVLGYKQNKIEKYISKNYKHLVKEGNTRNEYYKYLKYTDGAGGTTTVYFFLSDKNKCTRVKRMHVHSMKDEVIHELDSLYTRKGDNLWSERHRGIRSVIKLENEEWFFTVTIEPEQKE
ncbi:MAG: hypothetical protein U9N72_01725 [Bacteroidota bacterium]|nr:hypothetical protein [Bacteroidota bacterium]